MRITANTWTTRGFDLFCQAPILPDVVPAHHDILPCLPAGDGCRKVDFRAVLDESTCT
jgi:hypothetical protein